MTRYAAKAMVLKRETSTPGTYATVGQLLSLGKVGSKRNLIDASAFGDDEKKWLVGMRDGNEVTISVAVDTGDAVHVGLKSDYDNSVTRNFQLVHPNATTTRSFAAVVTSYDEGGDLDGVFVADIGLKISGAIT